MKSSIKRSKYHISYKKESKLRQKLNKKWRRN